MTGAAFCGWTSIYLGCRAVRGRRQAKKATSATKKRHGPAIGACQCCALPRNHLVRPLSGQPPYRRVLSTGGLGRQTALALSPAQRKRTVWRLDGGAGSDDQLRWLLARDYQVLAKGMSNRRAEALARQVRRWDVYQDAWLGEVAPPADYGRPVRAFVKRRRKDDAFHYSSYISTLRYPPKANLWPATMIVAGRNRAVPQ